MLFRGPPKADLRGKVREHFLVSADGRRVRFGLKAFSEDPWQFDLGAFKFAPAPAAPDDLHPADVSSLVIAGWEATNRPKLASTRRHKLSRLFSRADTGGLPLDKYETSHSLAIAPDTQSFVLGTGWNIYRFDKDGKALWKRGVSGVVWGLNLARNGRLIVAACGDGTIRWHRTVDGKELLRLFIHMPDDPRAEKRWVLWTPEGYYAASPGGEDLIGWHVNRGPDQAADFYPADIFRSTFYRPDVVQAALDEVDGRA